MNKTQQAEDVFAKVLALLQASCGENKGIGFVLMVANNSDHSEEDGCAGDISIASDCSSDMMAAFLSDVLASPEHVRAVTIAVEEHVLGIAAKHDVAGNA